MTTAEALKDLMDAWDKIYAAACAEYPNASENELYQIAASAMDHAVGLKPKRPHELRLVESQI